MRALLVGSIGIAIVIASTPVSNYLGSGGSAQAFRAGITSTYNGAGQRTVVKKPPVTKKKNQ